MARTGKTYWIHAVSSLHVGAGRGVGFIDLPIMREKTTNFPFVPGSSIKGVIADYFGATKENRESNELFQKAFGKADNDENPANRGDANAGSLVFTDARLVCLPVRSFFGTFAWVASPFVLSRLKRDLRLDGLPEVSLGKNEIACLAGGNGGVLPGPDGKVYLEDLDFTSCERDISPWAGMIAESVFKGTGWFDLFSSRFAVVSDDAFSFLAETGTEVAARVRIDPEKKIVASGALWYEESLPAETILAGTVWCDRVFGPAGQKRTAEDLYKEFCSSELDLQLGGKATTGKGLARCLFRGR